MSKEIKMISRDELQGLISAGKSFKLVDVLDKEHYEKEHIKGAISLPLDQIEKKAKKMFSKEDLMVVYCASFECQASTKAAEKLLKLGFKNVLDYKGGLQDYKSANLPLESSLHEETSRVTSGCISC